MRKLKLESLHVESFETTAAAPQTRGTVDGHAVPAPETRNCPIGTGVSECVVCQPVSWDRICTYDPRQCGETNYLDCTYGCSYRCSYNTGCVDVCWIDDRTLNCPVE